MPSRRGKPNLTPSQVQVILQLITLGASQATAAENVGVRPEAISNRKARDRDFAAAFAMARAKCKIGIIANIRRQAQKDWRAEAWIAERMFPEEFARPEIRAQLQIANVDTEELKKAICAGLAALALRHAPPDAADVAVTEPPAAAPRPDPDDGATRVGRS
jgi:hypothetical protein